MADKSQTRMRVARNFIKTYGRVRFHRLLTLLAQGISGQKLLMSLMFHVSGFVSGKTLLEKWLPLQIVPRN